MSIARAVSGIAAGSHACCTFSSDEEQQQLVGGFVADALARGSQVLYASDRTDESTIRDWLQAAGIDAERHLASSQFGILDTRDVYGSPTRFDPERQVALMQAVAEGTRRKGFAGLAGLSEMSWSLRDPTCWDAVLEYERALQPALAGTDSYGICQYDARLFDPESVVAARGAHHVSVDCDDSVCSTVWYGASLRDGGSRSQLHLAGELDVACAGQLATRIAGYGDGGEDIVLDVRRLEFADVSGCRALVEVARDLQPPQHLVLRNASPAVRRVLALCGFEEMEQLVIVQDGER